MNANHTSRIRVISLCLFGFALLLVFKLYLLQIVHNDIYESKADRQYVSKAGGVFSRGTIYFQNKDGSLVSGATLKSGVVVAINPQLVKDPEGAYEKINALVPLDKEVFLTKAKKPNDPYEEIARKVDKDIGAKITALKIPGVNVYKENWRFYPGGTTASHTIGMLGYKGDEYAGRYGLERFYEKVLGRTEGAYVNFFAEIFSNLKTLTNKTNEEEGDIVTSIEPTVQVYLQGLIASTTDKWGSEFTGGIIMNPKTGEIVAMAMYPTFDPNNPQNEKESAIFSNGLVENVYEMGSIVKPLTLAIGIDTGVITASSTYTDNGFVVINNKRISNFDGKARGTTTIQTALSQSLNVGMAHIVSLIGNRRFTDYMYKFGLNQKTGIDMPNEGGNLVKNLESPRDIEHATASFGQGIALTPITIVRAIGTIANDGVTVYPHLAKKINYKIGISKTIEQKVGDRVISSQTAKEVARMMTYSTDNTLVNGTLKEPHYSIAVKTGTAQVVKKGSGGYSDDEFLHSFIGFFPSYNPQFLVFLYTMNPKGARYGSETLSVPFMDTAKYLINYYNIAPDR